MPRIVLAVIALAIVTALSACADIPQTIAHAQTLRDQAAAARADLGARLADLRATRDALPPDAPAPDLDAAIALAQARAAALDAAVRHADLVLAEMTDPSDTLTQGVSALTPFLPAPAQGPALLGAALLATLLRARQVRKGAGSIVASIQHALKDPDFRAAFERHAPTIRGIQTPTARRIVDEVTKPGLMVRSPI
jgi:hypothetical protein